MFKEIPFTNGYYSCDEHGNIRSNLRIIVRKNNIPQTINSRILKPKLNNQGYLYVSLCYGNMIKDYLIHRLVAICHIPNPNNYQTINHKDKNTQNNEVENLEWCSQSQNNKHAFDNGKQPVGCKKVYQLDNDKNILKTFNSLTEASIEVKGDSKGKGLISKACRTNGKMYGYYWKF